MANGRAFMAVLEAIGPSLNTLWTCTYFGDEMASGAFRHEDLGVFIEENLLMTGVFGAGIIRSTFNVEAWNTLIHRTTWRQLEEIIVWLDNYNCGLSAALQEGCYDEEVHDFVKLVQQSDMDYFTFRARRDASERWTKIKTWIVFMTKFKKAAQKHHHPDRKRQRGEFKLL